MEKLIRNDMIWENLWTLGSLSNKLKKARPCGWVAERSVCSALAAWVQGFGSIRKSSDSWGAWRALETSLCFGHWLNWAQTSNFGNLGSPWLAPQLLFCLGIYLLLPPSYHKKSDLITYFFHFWWVFFFWKIPSIILCILHSIPLPSSWPSALIPFPRNHGLCSLSSKRTLPLTISQTDSCSSHGSWLHLLPPSRYPTSPLWLKKILYFSCYLGAKTIGELSRRRAFAAHSFLRDEASS